MDIINELAELGLATRLRRLGNRLSEDVTRIYIDLDIEINARWFPVLFALNKYSPINITSLAKSVGLTHTAINNITSPMQKNDILISTVEKNDERQRLLHITPKGKEIIIKLKPVLDEIEKIEKELIAKTGFDLLSAIRKIENQLDDVSLYERLQSRLSIKPSGKIEIKYYRPAYKKYFYSINKEWLEKFFSIEDEDKKIIEDPNGRIIKKGGTILFAIFNKNVVGTVALIQHKNGAYELAKMAVTKNFQGLGVGKKLLQKVVEHAKNLGVCEIYLLTNSKLKTANHIYRTHGFRRTKNNIFSENRFIRPTYTMKLILEREG